MKKVMSIFISVFLIFALALPTTAVASKQKTDNIQSNNLSTYQANLQELKEELLNAKSLDEIANISLEIYLLDPSRSSEYETEKAFCLLNEYTSECLDANSVAASSQVSSKELLAYMCMADGMTISNVATANKCADEAKNEAIAKYPNDPQGLQDTFRHFVWNHKMTTSLSEAKARIVACNYEWAAVLIKYAQSSFNDFVASGLSTQQAAAKAYNYAYHMRADCYTVCEKSLANFLNMFSNPDAVVRDFLNNDVGRYNAVQYTDTESYVEKFNIALYIGDVIVSDDEVTDYTRESVWAAKRYHHIKPSI